MTHMTFNWCENRPVDKWTTTRSHGFDYFARPPPKKKSVETRDMRTQAAERAPCMAADLPVIGGHHEVEQQPDGLLHIDLVGGGQPLVELVVDGRQDGLQPRHIDLGVVVQRVEAVVAKGFDHVPDIHQMNCEREAKQKERHRSMTGEGEGAATG